MRRCPGARAFKQHTTTSKKTLDNSIFWHAHEANVWIETAYGHYDFIPFPMLCSHVFQHKSNCANGRKHFDAGHFNIVTFCNDKVSLRAGHFRTVIKIQYSHLLTAGHHIWTIKACTGRRWWKRKVIETTGERAVMIFTWTSRVAMNWAVLAIIPRQSTRSVLGPAELQWLIWHDHVIHLE